MFGLERSNGAEAPADRGGMWNEQRSHNMRRQGERDAKAGNFDGELSAARTKTGFVIHPHHEIGLCRCLLTDWRRPVRLRMSKRNQMAASFLMSRARPMNHVS
jgi:hypothetical protein